MIAGTVGEFLGPDLGLLMDHIDGAITSLVNGHVLALIDRVDTLEALILSQGH